MKCKILLISQQAYASSKILYAIKHDLSNAKIQWENDNSPSHYANTQCAGCKIVEI